MTNESYHILIMHAILHPNQSRISRLRKEPGSWTGAKASRIATAALSAAAIGAAADSRKPENEKSKLGTIGGALGGLLVNRAVNGPRREMRD